ncbi:MAG: DUF1800 domain-containing protein [Candidatus Kapabacteria bacterium]|nr:DUF1800 domain-containing protein [Candidatus Kapabacteria bacterium]
MPIPVYNGPWDKSMAAHLVRRTMFGPTPADIQNALGKGLTGAVDALLATVATPAEPIAYLKTGAVAEGQPWAESTYEAGAENVRLTFLQSWWIDIMLKQTFSVNEKMTLFWANHFSTGSQQVKDSRYMYRQNAVLREQALGSVKDLVREITFDPAMLRYLSGSTNTKQSPNENFGREVQELFSIGKGPEVAPGDYTNYTEADVKAAARVLTGWSDVTSGISAKFTASNHDTGSKTFSARYGGRVITGRTGEIGARQEIDELITMIFDQAETARAIVRKLYRWFVDYVITTDTERDIIEPLAASLRTNNFEIKPVLRELFLSAHFYDNERIGCTIKTPVDLVIGTVRLFHVPDIFPDDLKKSHWAYRAMRKTLATMQIDLFSPPNVAGWPAYYQAPAFHELWINADTLQKRVRFTNELMKDGYQLDEAYEKSFADVFVIKDWVRDPHDAAKLVDDLVELFFPVAILPEQRQALIDIILEGQPASAWVVAWSAWEGSPDDAVAKAVVETRLRNLLKFMLAMAEYQVC